MRDIGDGLFINRHAFYPLQTGRQGRKGHALLPTVSGWRPCHPDQFAWVMIVCELVDVEPVLFLGNDALKAIRTQGLVEVLEGPERGLGLELACDTGSGVYGCLVIVVVVVEIGPLHVARAKAQEGA